MIENQKPHWERIDRTDAAWDRLDKAAMAYAYKEGMDVTREEQIELADAALNYASEFLLFFKRLA